MEDYGLRDGNQDQKHGWAARPRLTVKRLVVTATEIMSSLGNGSAAGGSDASVLCALECRVIWASSTVSRPTLEASLPDLTLLGEPLRILAGTCNGSVCLELT